MTLRRPVGADPRNMTVHDTDDLEPSDEWKGLLEKKIAGELGAVRADALRQFEDGVQSLPHRKGALIREHRKALWQNTEVLAERRFRTQLEDAIEEAAPILIEEEERAGAKKSKGKKSKKSKVKKTSIEEEALEFERKLREEAEAKRRLEEEQRAADEQAGRDREALERREREEREREVERRAQEEREEKKKRRKEKRKSKELGLPREGRLRPTPEELEEQEQQALAAEERMKQEEQEARLEQVRIERDQQEEQLKRQQERERIARQKEVEAMKRSREEMEAEERFRREQDTKRREEEERMEKKRLEEEERRREEDSRGAQQASYRKMDEEIRRKRQDSGGGVDSAWSSFGASSSPFSSSSRPPPPARNFTTPFPGDRPPPAWASWGTTPTPTTPSPAWSTNMAGNTSTAGFPPRPSTTNPNKPRSGPMGSSIPDYQEWQRKQAEFSRQQEKKFREVQERAKRAAWASREGGRIPTREDLVKPFEDNEHASASLPSGKTSNSASSFPLPWSGGVIEPMDDAFDPQFRFKEWQRKQAELARQQEERFRREQGIWGVQLGMGNSRQQTMDGELPSASGDEIGRQTPEATLQQFQNSGWAVSDIMAAGSPTIVDPFGKGKMTLRAQVLMQCSTGDLRRALWSLRGNHAQGWLDAMQGILDSPPLPGLSAERTGVLKALLRLSKEANRYPSCLHLNGQLQKSKYPVAEGAFGQVYRGTIGGHDIALKEFRVYTTTDMERLRKAVWKEAILWCQLYHLNVLPCYGVYDPPMCPSIGLVSPWVEDGNIGDYLLRNPYTDRLLLLSDVASGMSYLHKEKIVHGDLKGANILVTMSGRACLADFGLSVLADSSLNWTSIKTTAKGLGTARWQAPELLAVDDDEEDDVILKTTQMSDVYSFGCVCYEVMTGKIPFYQIKKDFTIPGIVSRGDRPRKPELSDPSFRSYGLTEGVWAFMGTCWKADPAQRPSSSEIQRNVLFSSLVDSRPRQQWGEASAAEFRRRIMPESTAMGP